MIIIEAKIDRFDLKTLAQYARELPSRTLLKLHRVILATAIEVQGEAKESMTDGNPSGRISKRRTVRANRSKGLGRRTLIHQASAPGQPPSSDTGTLVNSIGVFDAQKKKSIMISVGSTVKHGLYTEEGTKRMKKRPWLKPSIEASRPGLEKRVAALARELGE